MVRLLGPLVAVLLLVSAPLGAAGGVARGDGELAVEAFALPAAIVQRLPAAALDEVLGAIGPLERALLVDACDGTLDTHGLVAAALVAGGVQTAGQRQRYERRFEAVAAEFAARPQPQSSPRDQVRQLLEFLHARVLTGAYREDCTSLARVLDTGDYNCVSSLILFQAAADRLGLAVGGLESPGHACAVLYDGDARIVIETTCADWFARRGQRPVLARRTADSHHKGGPTWQERPLSAVGLVAVVYYNRGIDALVARRFGEAAWANAAAVALDADNPAARSNLLATLNNWALACYDAGGMGEAITLLEHGLELAPEHQTFRTNLDVILGRMNRQGQSERAAPVAADETPSEMLEAAVRRLVAAGRYEQALALAAQWSRTATETPDGPPLRREVLAAWAREALRTGDYQAAVLRLKHDASPPEFDPRLRALLRDVYDQWIVQLRSEGAWREAGLVVDQADADPYLIGTAVR